MSVRQNIIEPFALLPHGQDLQNYLITFAAAATGKKKPPADYIHDLKPHSGIFVDASDVGNLIDAIGAIYREKGYRSPSDLENDLIRKCQPGLSERAISIADHYTEAERAPDTLTGFQQKTQVPLTMALAALYQQSTGKPVSVIEIDFSNMRGTNEHFEQIIAAAENSTITPFIQKESMTLTDKAAFIVASTIRRTIEGDHPQGKTFSPLRTGGDEVRIVLPDIPLEQANHLVENVHAAIEDVTARLDLHDHPHSKRPLDPISNGFGACAAAFELKAEGQQAYEDAVYLADQKIQKAKIDLGRKRQDSAYYDLLKPPGPRTPEIYKNSQLAQNHFMAVLKNIAGLNVDLEIDTDAKPKSPAIEDLVQNLFPDHFLTLEQMHKAFSSHLESDLDAAGIMLTPEETRILRIKASRFPAIDHATGTLMARDLPAIAGVAAKITASLNERAQTNQPLWTMGASFHNLSGLNEALGHEAANAVLHRQAHDVIEQSLFRAGISRENFYLAHMGGGEFRALIQPVILDSDGSSRMIDKTTMQAVKEMIGQKTKILAGEFSNIENPREDLRPWENGITVTVITKPYEIDPQLNTSEFRRGGAIVASIGDHLLEEIQEKRKSYVQQPGVKNMTPDMF